MKIILSSIVLICLVGTGYVFFTNKRQQTLSSPQNVAETVAISPTVAQTSITATFTIVTRGTTRDFSDPRYHYQSEVVYLEPSNPSVVHVKKNGVTWRDFFQTLPMSLSEDCLITGTQQTFCTTSSEKLRFFINNTEDGHVLDKAIQEGDRLHVTYGK